MIKKIILGVIAVFGLVLTFGSEGAYDTDLFTTSDQGGEHVIISHTPWEDSIAASYLIEDLLTQSGYSVELVQLDPAILFSSVATGQSDFSVSPWLPNTHGAYYEQFKDRIEYISAHATEAQNGLTVPAYMDVNSIADLTTEANQIITGIEPGAGITEQTNNLFDAYPNLSEWTHHESSTGAMLTQLEQALRNEEEIVFPGWTPHWMYVEYDLKVLEDPEFVYGGGEELAAIGRIGFKEEFPAIYRFVEEFEWSVDDISLVMLYISEGLTAREATNRWVNDNPQQFQEWLDILQTEE